MPKQIDVVGAVLVENGKVLCAKRGSGGSLPGLWEFPGGKIEQGETAEVALRREIMEELSCEIAVGEPVATTTHQYDFGVVTLTTFLCSLTAGWPELSEHDSLVWLLPNDLDRLEWAPADIPAVAVVRSLLSQNA